jgi:hypothetical protein
VGRYVVARLLDKHGDATLTDLLLTLKWIWLTGWKVWVQLPPKLLRLIG